MSDYDEFMETDCPLAFLQNRPGFVENEVVPRVGKALEEFGLGWYDEGEIHTLEIQALIWKAMGKAS